MFEIKGNVSSKVYFRFSFLFPLSCTGFTFIRKPFDACNFDDESKSCANAAKNPFEPL